MKKGRAYTGQVHTNSKSTISAYPHWFPAPARQPYTSSARLVHHKNGRISLISGCTCPVGVDCKHVAAMLLKAIDERNPVDRVSTGILSWVADLRRVSIAVAKKKTRPASARQQLFYILKSTPDHRHFGVEIRKGKYPESAEEWWKIDRALVTPPQFVNEEDLGILRLIWADRGNESSLRAFGLGPKHGAEIMQRMAASHRLYPKELGLAADCWRQPPGQYRLASRWSRFPAPLPETRATS